MFDFLGGFSLANQAIWVSFFSIVFSAVFAFGISLLYRATHTGMNYEPSFLSTLILLAPIVTVVMLFIHGDLVLSLGLVGSLSIIRFRTPIKDTRDMIFLFWAIAIGLGSGTFNWIIVIVSSVTLAIITLLLYFLRFERPSHQEYILVIIGEENDSMESARQIVRKFCPNAQLRSHEIQDQTWEGVFELRLKSLDGEASSLLMQELSATAGISKISLLAPQIALPA
ncbi:MAG: DUF4956 domain-containing protein [Firmicutes bacterium]|nr:DUF4956 domain-containing protein [Bacillota bacterium]